jgi:ribonuclease HII
VEFNERELLQNLSSHNKEFIIACDEVGRGPLAGPVIGCSTYLKLDSAYENIIDELSELGINDSKKISATKRKKIMSTLGFKIENLQEDTVYEIELVSGSLYFCLGGKTPEEIDQLNILQASLQAMKKSAANLKRAAGAVRGHVLIDGNKTFSTNENVTVASLVKGDSKSLLIALASIFAKEFRDYLMEKYDEEFPQYGFKSHSGYPTKSHKEAIKKFGVLPIHRKTFGGVKEFVQR